MTTIAERSGVLFPTAVVGSLPRPDYVRQIVVDGSGGDDGPRYLDTAVAHAVALQESAGLDVVSDGEWRRASYIGIIAELASGFALEIAERFPDSPTPDGLERMLRTRLADRAVAAAEDRKGLLLGRLMYRRVFTTFLVAVRSRPVGNIKPNSPRFALFRTPAVRRALIVCSSNSEI